MSRKKQWTAAEKLKIALEACGNDDTIASICERYKVAASQVYAWKKQLIEEGSSLFDKKSESRRKKEAQQIERERDTLYAKIGQLTVERDFLKKAYSSFPESKDRN